MGRQRKYRQSSQAAEHIVAETFELSTSDDKIVLGSVEAVELSPVDSSAEIIELRTQDDKLANLFRQFSPEMIAELLEHLKQNLMNPDTNYPNPTTSENDKDSDKLNALHEALTKAIHELAILGKLQFEKGSNRDQG